MPKKSVTPPKSGGPAPLRAMRNAKPAVKRPDPRDPDPRDIGRGSAKARPSGGRPPRFPGRTGGR